MRRLWLASPRGVQTVWRRAVAICPFRHPVARLPDRSSGLSHGTTGGVGRKKARTGSASILELYCKWGNCKPSGATMPKADGHGIKSFRVKLPPIFYTRCQLKPQTRHDYGITNKISNLSCGRDAVPLSGWFALDIRWESGLVVLLLVM